MFYFHQMTVQQLLAGSQVWLPGWAEAINNNKEFIILNNWSW